MESLCYPEPDGLQSRTSHLKSAAAIPSPVVVHRPVTGSAEQHVFSRRSVTGNAGLPMLLLVEEEPTQAERTAVQNLLRIQEVFKPAMTELATLFGVSRQALYNWRNGETPRADQIRRLDELARCADVIAAAALGQNTRLLTRKAIGDQSLFDLVRAGRPAVDFAHEMVQLVRVEQQRRERLNARFRDRPTLADLPELSSPRSDLP